MQLGGSRLGQDDKKAVCLFTASQKTWFDKAARPGRSIVLVLCNNSHAVVQAASPSYYKGSGQPTPSRELQCMSPHLASYSAKPSAVRRSSTVMGFWCAHKVHKLLQPDKSWAGNRASLPALLGGRWQAVEGGGRPCGC